MPTPKYRKYNTGFKLQIASGILEKDELKNIPKTNRYRWKKLDIKSFWLPETENYEHENLHLVNALHEIERLKQMVRCLIYILALYKAITNLFEVNASHYLQVKQIADTCIKKINTCNAKKYWKWLPFTKHQWSAFNSRKVCQASLVQLCRISHPNQLSFVEIEAIKQAAENTSYANWPLSSIYYQLMRTRVMFCSISCFYKYCRLLNITRYKPKKNQQYRPLKANEPFKILHMDVTIYKTLNGAKSYLHVIRDNFSRAILACKVTATNCSRGSMETLCEVLEKYNLLNKTGCIVTDDGAENKGEVKEWLKKTGALWKQLIAQLDITQSNSMVEAANKILKYQFLYKTSFATMDDLIAAMPEILKAYNNMPARSLYGLTPQEVLEGQIPNKDLYKPNIANGRKQRIAANQQTICKAKNGCVDSG